MAVAAREALTNVDRHAAATAVTITVEPGSLRIVDNGRGFDPTRPSGRHGIARSITARMSDLGGNAIVTSHPGRGTTIELRWPTTTPTVSEPTADPERLIERTRTGYGLSLTTYAIANLLAMMPTALHPAGHPQLQWALASITALTTVSAAAPILGRPVPVSRLGVAVLLIVALTQSITLSVDQLGTQAQWSQGVIGWCVLPLLLGERVRSAAGILIGCWAIPAIYALLRDPSTHTVVNLGYGTASILIVQLCALFFDNLIRQAAATAGAEADTRTRLTATERIADAVQAEYLRRYAELADTVRPLLLALANGRAVDATTRRHARSNIKGCVHFSISPPRSTTPCCASCGPSSTAPRTTVSRYRSTSPAPYRPSTTPRPGD
ncbi:ATP-binding protein [Mycolicibacterium sp. CBMA 226]|uniref:sensor histidine kinase n=1 Tax=Mycolicibacterium sp. CBMA 226 TaxID=2606611 RepID=UPI0028BDB768|nr:ATP-binding protein [Mycolicibacterium sp. CBMA 226]